MVTVTVMVQSSLLLFPHSSLHSRVQLLVLTVAASFSSTATTISTKMVTVTVMVQSSLLLFPHSSLHSRVQSLVLTIAASFSSIATTISSTTHGFGLPLQSSSTATRRQQSPFFPIINS